MPLLTWVRANWLTKLIVVVELRQTSHVYRFLLSLRLWWEPRNSLVIKLRRHSAQSVEVRLAVMRLGDSLTSLHQPACRRPIAWNEDNSNSTIPWRSQTHLLTDAVAATFSCMKFVFHAFWPRTKCRGRFVVRWFTSGGRIYMNMTNKKCSLHCWQ